MNVRQIGMKWQSCPGTVSTLVLGLTLVCCTIAAMVLINRLRNPDSVHLVAIEFVYAIEEEEKEEKQRKLAQQVKKKIQIQTVVTEDVEASTCCTNCASRNTKKRKR
jgi:sugar phosphate permease